MMLRRNNGTEMHGKPSLFLITNNIYLLEEPVELGKEVHIG